MNRNLFTEQFDDLCITLLYFAIYAYSKETRLHCAYTDYSFLVIVEGAYIVGIAIESQRT